MFTSDLDVTITYRGGLLVRETGPDSVNAEARGVLAFFDVTFPEKQKDREDLLTLSLGAGGPEDFTWQSAFMGNNAVTDVWPNGSGTGSAFPYAPAPGETLTFAYYSATAGPTSLLGEDDPYLVLLSDYTYNIGPDRVSGRAAFAVLDQDPDENVLDDVRASIDKVAESWAGATGGADSFERRLSPWLGGMELASMNTLSGNSDPAGDAMEDPDTPSAGEELSPPSLPEDESTAPEAPSDPVPDADVGGPDNDGGSTNTGRSYVQPQKIIDPYTAALAMLMNLGVPTHEFGDCTEVVPTSPCLTVTRHMHSDGKNNLAHVRVRLEPGANTYDYDFALLITADDPMKDGWVIDKEWTFGDGDKPAWSW